MPVSPLAPRAVRRPDRPSRINTSSARQPTSTDTHRNLRTSRGTAPSRWGHRRSAPWPCVTALDRVQLVLLGHAFGSGEPTSTLGHLPTLHQGGAEPERAADCTLLVALVLPALVGPRPRVGALGVVAVRWAAVAPDPTARWSSSSIALQFGLQPPLLAELKS